MSWASPPAPPLLGVGPGTGCMASPINRLGYLPAATHRLTPCLQSSGYPVTGLALDSFVTSPKWSSLISQAGIPVSTLTHPEIS